MVKFYNFIDLSMKILEHSLCTVLNGLRKDMCSIRILQNIIDYVAKSHVVEIF